MNDKSNSKIWDLIDTLSNKEGISEIIINDLSNVFIERDDQFVTLESKLTLEDMNLFAKDIAKLNNKKYDADNPILDGSLPDGSRVNIISELYTNEFPAITIRKYNRSINSFDDGKELFGLSPSFKDFLKVLALSKSNIIVSGGTGVGKTTFLNLLLNEIDFNERLITIEDTRELTLDRSNIVNLVARSNIFSEKSLSARDLVKNTLRMRPDRIIIGEVRGGEFFDLMQAMNTGHEGSMTTVHANKGREGLIRMESLFLLAQTKEIPLRAVRHQISSAVDYIIQLSRDNTGKRIVSEILEITGMENENILTQEIANVIDDKLRFTGLVPSNMKKLIPYGLKDDFFMNFQER